MAYAGFEGMDGHRAADWENGKAVNADWTDNNGYWGGHYGYGGYGYGAHGSGNRKNEEEDNWDDGSNDKEKEGYYPTREDIKEDTKMLSKLKPDWMTNPWHYGYGYGGKDGKSKDGDKKEEGKKGEEAKGDDKAEDKEAIQAAAEDFETADSAEDPRDNAAADDSDAINVQTKTSKTHKKKRGPKSKRVRLS